MVTNLYQSLKTEGRNLQERLNNKCICDPQICLPCWLRCLINWSTLQKTCYKIFLYPVTVKALNRVQMFVSVTRCNAVATHQWHFSKGNVTVKWGTLRMRESQWRRLTLTEAVVFPLHGGSFLTEWTRVSCAGRTPHDVGRPVSGSTWHTKYTNQRIRA
jgi:hypothetical protein